ncbi:MAG: hypothetical protein RL173_3103, partial [Fibrobacterota bacterium]
MKPGLSILLAAGVFSAHAGIITSAGIVADRSGTRIVLSATEEPLSRSSVESDGTLRIEVQGSRTTLSGTHALPSNAAYASVEATTRELEGGAVSVFRFQPRKQGGFAKVKHREWDGSALAFLLDKEPAKSPMVDFWTVPVATTQVGSQVFASLTVVPALQDVRAWGVGDFETVEFRFPSPTIKAELVGSGKKFVIRLGKARLAGKLAPPASATKLIQSIAASKDDGGDAITITLKQDARSILLARAGSSVVLRMVSTSANPVAWNWNSKAGKLESFNAASLPSDEA